MTVSHSAPHYRGLRSVAALAFAILLLTLPGCDSGGGGEETLPPPPPVRLSAVQGSGSISLSWDTNAPERTDGFNVYRAAGQTPTADGTPVNGGTPVSEPAFVDDGVTDGTVYQYVVTAVGEGGESDASSSVEIRYFPDPPTRP